MQQDLPGAATPKGMNVRPQFQHERARQLEILAGQQDGRERAQFEPACDERLSSILHNRSFGSQGHIAFGKVIYSTPYTHWYRVQLADADADFPCCMGTDCAPLPMSVRSTGVIPPQSKVLVFKHPDLFYGVILCVLPEIVNDGTYVHPDWISQGSNAGFLREGYYWEAFNLLKRRGNIIDFSDDRPNDGTCIGEWGRLSHLGNGIHIDQFMQFFRMDESCGLWLFYMDRLARLAAYNFDLRTAMSELVVRNDQGEGVWIHGYNPYPWQVMGMWQPKITAHQEHEPKDVLYEKPFATYEPKELDQQSFYRCEEHYGYLGQAYMRQVMLPPKMARGINRYQDQGDGHSRIGVFREQIGLDGSYGITSAQSVHICKRILIPIPKRIALIEDEKDGDGGLKWEDEQNYKHASTYGQGPDHKVADAYAPGDKAGGEEEEGGGEAPKGEEECHLLGCAALSDILANAFNWKSLHPFVYHEKDYWTPQEDEIPPFETLLNPPQFSQLGESQYLSRPGPRKAWVDSRYGNQNYWETTSGVHLLPDGSVVIRDGYGSEIRMSGGHIYENASGDIHRCAGRDTVDYAGHDAIIRARESVDVTAANHDVHIKAEFNVDILAGNNGQMGRMLLENQAAGPAYDFGGKQGEDVSGSGIIMKARHSEVVALARNIYLRTGSRRGGIDQGDIVLDAAQGKQDIRTISRAMNNHCNIWVNDSFPASANKKVTHMRSAILACTPTPHEILGGVIICQNGVMQKYWTLISQGHIATEFAPLYNYLVCPLSDGPLDKVNEAIAEALSTFEYCNEKMSDDFLQGVVEMFWEYPRIGSDAQEWYCEYAPRTEKQMITEDWKFPEAYWQQLGRLSGQNLDVWKEPFIKYQGARMMPHPGFGKWAQESSYWTMDLRMHEANKGLDIPHDMDSIYTDPALNYWGREKPQENYLVSVQPVPE